MSILPHPPLVAVVETFQISWELVVLSIVAVVIAIFAGVVPFRRVPGPPRLAPERSAWPLAGILFGAMGLYFFAISACVALWNGLAPKFGSTAQPLESDAGLALLNTLPPLIVLIGLLPGDRLVHDSVRQDLGVRPRLVPRGLFLGFLAALLVIPLLFLASQVMELIYHAVHYEHPTEHPMLHILGEGPNPWIKATIIIGACILAPVFEELIFRAHLQTLLLRAIQWTSGLARRASAPSTEANPFPFAGQTSPALEMQLPPVDGQLTDPQPELPHPQAALDDQSRIANRESQIFPPPRPWMCYLSIVVTSLLFASVHPAWSIPIIFLLSLCLGYAYERTGNLWVSITLHATFNIVSTILFLAGAGSH